MLAPAADSLSAFAGIDSIAPRFNRKLFTELMMPRKKSAATKSPKRAQKPAKRTASLNSIYNEVSRRADTDGLAISAAETRRVLASFFDLLEDLDPREAFAIVADGLKQAGARRR